MIERESPGRKLFGLFSYIQNDGRIVHNFTVELFTILWYNLNTKIVQQIGIYRLNRFPEFI